MHKLYCFNRNDCLRVEIDIQCYNKNLPQVFNEFSSAQWSSKLLIVCLVLSRI